MGYRFAAFTAYFLVFSVSISQCCFPGFYFKHKVPFFRCEACPPNTYKDVFGYHHSCTPCPPNSGHSIFASKTISDCRCFTGYSGFPAHGIACTIRHCEPLIAPPNAVFVGACSTEYLSVCHMKCNERFGTVGSEVRRCEVTVNDAMAWSGTPLQCLG
ncbi:hypothetical protein ACROYT_G019714 [Oculina patagonica]